MSKTAEAKGHFTGRFRTSSGFKVRASFDRKTDGTWKIFSVCSDGGITAFLPYSVSLLPRMDPFPTLEDAKAAVKAA